MTKNYGLPYKGSKNKIAETIVEAFPEASNFYDLFSGGCAVTHFALIQNKFKKYFINDIDGAIPELFVNALNGNYKPNYNWITKEDFKALKDKDASIKLCWSFGNAGNNYLYGADNIPYKKALFDLVVNNDKSGLEVLGIEAPDCAEVDLDKRRKFYCGYFKKENSKKENPVKALERLQNLESVSRIERIKSIENTAPADNIILSSKSYEEIEIEPDSIIYCDIPYKDTEGYNGINFDYEAFYKWCLKQKELVFISSYEMPEDFIPVLRIKHRNIYSSNKNNFGIIEKVFIPKQQIQQFQIKAKII